MMYCNSQTTRGRVHKHRKGSCTCTTIYKIILFLAAFLGFPGQSQPGQILNHTKQIDTLFDILGFITCAEVVSTPSGSCIHHRE